MGVEAAVMSRALLWMDFKGTRSLLPTVEEKKRLAEALANIGLSHPANHVLLPRITTTQIYELVDLEVLVVVVLV